MHMYPDGKNAKWQLKDVAKTIAVVYQKHPFQSVLSFDKRGVSGHPNHISSAAGVRQFLSEINFSSNSLVQEQLPIQIRHYELVTHPIPLRVFGVFSALIRYSLEQFFSFSSARIDRILSRHSSEHFPTHNQLSTTICLPSPTHTVSAVFCHRSQLQFHRRWNSYLSYYSYANVLRLTNSTIGATPFPSDEL